MKLVHVQIFAAAMAVGFVGSSLAAMSVASSKRELERKLSKAEADRDSARKAAKTPADLLKPKTGARDVEAENKQLLDRVRGLEKRVKDLEKDNDQLKKSLGQAIAAAPAPKPAPGGGGLGGLPQPPAAATEAPATGQGATPPPPPPPPGQNPWGASEDTELDEMTTELKGSPEQREQWKRFIIDGQNEFEQRLIEASKSGERDILVIERIGEEVSARTQSKIDQTLFPEQKVKFAALMRRKRGEQ
jgi:hypothetical protein